jgi:RNA polymerase sigma-70 factor (ECF subfamily)
MPPTDAELTDLYTRYAPVLLHRCRSILRNEEAAQDAVQETFARVMRNWEQFRGQSSPLTWMYRISTNYCLNQLRNAKTRQAKHDNHLEEIVGPQTVPADEQGSDRSRVLQLLNEVDDETRAVVVHTYFDDCTRAETATLVGLSVPTVRKRLNTFLDHARRAFEAATLFLAVWATGSTPWT